MKIHKTNKSKNKLLNFKLMETKVYKNFKFFDYINIENIEFSFKKAISIIYKYNTNNKQILFVICTPLDLPKKLLQHLFKNTKHIVIPESLWVNGTFYHKFLTKNTKTCECLLKLKQTPDLIVTLNKTSKINIREKKYTTTFLNHNFAENESNYKILRNNFFYDSLLAIFKK